MSIPAAFEMGLIERKKVVGVVRFHRSDSVYVGKCKLRWIIIKHAVIVCSVAKLAPYADPREKSKELSWGDSSCLRLSGDCCVNPIGWMGW